MPETKKEKQIPSSTAIRRAADASRRMTIEQRANLLVKAGLVSQEQVSKASKKSQGLQ